MRYPVIDCSQIEHRSIVKIEEYLYMYGECATYGQIMAMKGKYDQIMLNMGIDSREGSVCIWTCWYDISENLVTDLNLYYYSITTDKPALINIYFSNAIFSPNIN